MPPLVEALGYPIESEGGESLHTGDSIDQLAKNRLFSRLYFLMGCTLDEETPIMTVFLVDRKFCLLG